jgi:hypothetical protein
VTPTRVGIVLAGLAWLAAAIMLGASGRLQALQPPGPQLVVATLTVMVLVVVAVVAPLRRWALTVDARTLVAIHVIRLLAGSYFLILYYRDGLLPYAFAVPGGSGDVLVAVLAIALLATTSPLTVRGRWLYAGWNVVGLVDILFVVGTAARLGVAEPGSMRALLQIPLSLLPTFVVPLIIASHALLALRLRGS